MNLFYILVKLFILVVLLVFAYINIHETTFFYAPNQPIQLPLIVILFGAFVAGSIFGLFTLFGRLIRLRAENSRLRSELEKASHVNTQDISK